MDQKSWRWRKKSSLKRIDEEVQMHEGERDRIVKNLNEKLASVLLDCHAKDDDHVIKNDKRVPESNADFEELTHSDAAMKTSTEFERATKALQDNLTQTNKRLKELEFENSGLSKTLLVKERLIEDQWKHKSLADAEFGALMARLDDIEKENALLKYELHVVEKELEIRNEEMEYNRRSADLARKQHLDGAKRMAMLEAECRKLLKAEEENRVLKAIMIHSSRLDHSRISSTPNRVEIPTMEIVRSGQISRELSVTSGFDIGSIDGNSSYCSWPNALGSESELSIERRVKNPNLITVPEMRFMDDFEEMEKLALVAGSGYNPISGGVDHCEFSNTKQMNSIDLVAEGSFDWLQVVLHAISKHKRVSNRGFDEILDDIEIALDCSNRLSVHDVIDISEGQSHNFASSHDHSQSAMSRVDDIRCSLQEENRRLQDDLNSMEAMLESETRKNEALTIKLHESEESIGILLTELKMLKESNEMIEDEVENQTQLTVAKAKLNEIFQKCSSLEVELEYKNNCCEELEATCLELQLQLESLAKKETPTYFVNQEGKQSQNSWEITAASVKLAECQETIMNIGKQLKVLASSQDAALFDRVFSNNGDAAAPTAINDRKVKKRFSLRDRMLADDGDKGKGSKCPSIQGTLCVDEAASSLLPQSNNFKNTQASDLLLKTSEADLGSKNESGNVGAMALARVPSKKQGVGFLRRLFLRRKKGYSKKTCQGATEG
ncbi:RING/U-box domain-containing protein isoform 1 [Hibiscus syriacus]|uniref:RING/U-box domain-containing protein isoform 1 n=1 Tax=Hibiscus syriacus TaxID=106335 RepID=A0A6A3BRX1_HIBSY|nr:filament-like plant protein 7 [Hibiscus syriacus]XP_039065742.1 filament-like plant protein 7 [Hibiscus syriacus]KAE8719354.1 RING/U-box domain-containing protein isoform 1 [Hibiscus syriacus]